MNTDNILGVIGLLCLLAWVAWDMPAAIERTCGKVTLRYSPWVRYFYLFSAFAIPLGITVLAICQQPKGPSEMRSLCLLYALFGVLGVPMWWMTTRFAVTISDAGVECHSPWRFKRCVPWADVIRLTYGEFFRWFILDTRSGYRFRVPEQIVPGLTYFREVVAQHLRQNEERSKV